MRARVCSTFLGFVRFYHPLTRSQLSASAVARQ